MPWQAPPRHLRTTSIALLNIAVTRLACPARPPPACPAPPPFRPPTRHRAATNGTVNFITSQYATDVMLRPALSITYSTTPGAAPPPVTYPVQVRTPALGSTCRGCSRGCQPSAPLHLLSCNG